MSQKRTIDITVGKQGVYRSGWMPGLVMIALGALFLAHSYGFPFPENWWAFFLLIPALPYLARAWAWALRGEIRAAISQLVSSLFFVALATALFLELDWSHVWPVFLILAGVAMIFTGRSRVSD